VQVNAANGSVKSIKYTERCLPCASCGVADAANGCILPRSFPIKHPALCPIIQTNLIDLSATCRGPRPVDTSWLLNCVVNCWQPGERRQTAATHCTDSTSGPFNVLLIAFTATSEVECWPANCTPNCDFTNVANTMRNMDNTLRARVQPETSNRVTCCSRPARAVCATCAAWWSRTTMHDTCHVLEHALLVPGTRSPDSPLHHAVPACGDMRD